MSTKKCPKCGSPFLVLYQSMNQKQCAECRLTFDWFLDEGQQPLITSSKDRGFDNDIRDKNKRDTLPS